jgi:PAS domain S-box-containing protein
MPTHGLALALIGAAAVMNRSGKWKWAAWTLTFSVLSNAILLVIQARDGFRSNAMLLFPELLLISMMLLDRMSYFLTATVILLAVTALGIAERQGLTAAVPGVRTPTSYGSIFFVELSMLVFAAVGNRIVRDTQSNVSDLRTIIDRLRAANIQLEQSAEALRESELRYRRLHESITDAVVAVDMDGRILETNPAYEAMLGYTGGELRRLRDHELTPEPWHDFEAKVVAEQILTKESSEVYEKEYRRRDGTVFPIELRRYLLRDRTNQPAGMWAIVRDITGRKQAEAELRESEERFRKLFEEGPLGLALVTRDHHFVKVNAALCQMVGYSGEELLRMTFVEITHAADRSSNLEDSDRLFRGEIPIYRMQKRYVRKDGAIVWIKLTAALVPDYNGDPVALGMIEDITEARHNQEQAFARQKLESVGTLASGIAHDFNNLLGAVLAQADLAQAEYASGDSPAEPLKVIQNLAIRGSEIVQQLMVYAGKEREALELVNVSSVVGEMLELIKVSVSKHARLEANLGERLPAVRGRAAQLRQIVINLVTNASEAIGDQDGVIRLTTRWVTVGPAAEILKGVPEGEYVELAVADNGAGMSPETQARVFDPFFTTKSVGRGLGLGVVHGIVRSLGGGIHIASEPGKGTTVHILLPCAEAGPDATIDLASGAEEVAPPSQRLTVLVVEDEDPLRQAVMNILRREGFAVLEVSNGSAAIDLLRANEDRIDVVLLDMTIPGASSQEVVAEAVKAKPAIKVILTSAYSREMITDRIDASQVHDFIRKPFRLADLVKMVQSAVLG